MRTPKYIEQISWPEGTECDNFQFDSIAEAGSFTFHFKWLNDRWNLWVTFPDGTKCQAGVYPNVVSWSEHSNYGLLIKTPLEAIDYNSLFMTELYLITWE